MKNILFATDGSQGAAAAIDLLKRLPLPPACRVTVLTVLEDVAPMLYDPRIDSDGFSTCFDNAALEQFNNARNEEADRLVGACAQELQDTGWTVDTVIEHDVVAHGIIESAVRLKSDLIVVGSHGASNIQRFLVGSVSRNLVEYAPCSVLVARGSHARTDPAAPLRILLALDGSAPAKAALADVVQMASDGPVRAVVLSALPTSRFYRMDILEQLTDAWQEQKQLAQEQLDAAATALRNAGVEVTVELSEGGSVSEDIISAAAANDTDIIVAGHRGRSGIERFLLGSVARRLVCHAGCSVWIHREN